MPYHVFGLSLTWAANPLVTLGLPCNGLTKLGAIWLSIYHKLAISSSISSSLSFIIFLAISLAFFFSPLWERTKSRIILPNLFSLFSSLFKKFPTKKKKAIFIIKKKQ